MADLMTLADYLKKPLSENHGFWFFFKTFGPGLLTTSLAGMALKVALTQRKIAANKYHLDFFALKSGIYKNYKDFIEKNKKIETQFHIYEIYHFDYILKSSTEDDKYSVSDLYDYLSGQKEMGKISAYFSGLLNAYRMENNYKKMDDPDDFLVRIKFIFPKLNRDIENIEFIYKEYNKLIEKIIVTENYISSSNSLDKRPVSLSKDGKIPDRYFMILLSEIQNIIKISKKYKDEINGLKQKIIQDIEISPNPY